MPRAFGSSNRPNTKRPCASSRRRLYDDPNDADAYYNLAATYHRMGRLEHRQSDLDQAECYYNQCLDRNPNHTECYRGLAVLLAEQGRKDDAFRLVEGWVQRQPTSADAKIELARLNNEFGNRQAAQEQLIEALAVEPDNPRALDGLGQDSRGGRRQGPGVGQLPAITR